ncbi:MAG: FliG C-terminal domain-containing protein [Thermoguttaceae bacterium]
MDEGTHDYAGVRKAAILVASLDPGAADALLARLTPEQAGLVRQALDDVQQPDADEQLRVIDEFCRIRPMIPKDSLGGIDLSGLKPHTLFGGGDQASAVTAAGSAAPFDFLRDASDGRLAQLLAEERPATIAVVLSHLPPEQGGEVLARLAPALQIEVVRRLSSLEEIDPETVRQIEQALESRLNEQSMASRRRAAGPESAARILAACDGGLRGQILDNLAVADRSLAEQLGRPTIAFDDLVQFDEATLRTVLAAAGPEMVQAALLGAEPKLLSRLLSSLPARDAKALRKKLAHPEPIRLSEVEDARQQIAALAARCHSDRAPMKERLAA